MDAIVDGDRIETPDFTDEELAECERLNVLLNKLWFNDMASMRPIDDGPTPSQLLPAKAGELVSGATRYSGHPRRTAH